MNKKFLLFLTWLFLQALSWYVQPLFSCVAFVPLLLLLRIKNKHTLLWAYFYLLFWHLSVLFWFYEIEHWLKASEAILFNTLVTYTPIWLGYLLSRNIPFLAKYKYADGLILILLWLLMEYLQHFWFMGFPWLLIGNTFGASPAYVQWYAYTGVLGGSLWVWLCAGAICLVIENYRVTKYYFLSIAVILFPLLYSWYLYTQPSEKVGVEVIFVQSNIEYSESDKEKLEILLEALEGVISDKTDYLLLPETFFASPLWETQIRNTVLYLKIKQIQTKYPKLHIIFGANLKKISYSQTKHREWGLFFNSYNVAIQLTTNENFQMKEKARFVPVEEYVPDYLHWLPVESDFLSLPTSPEKCNFESSDRKRSFYIGICYELVNSFFIKNTIKKEDKAIFMIASEAFMKNSQIGMKQYMHISALRALENQKKLIKSSSKGFAFVANSKGEIEYLLSPNQKKIQVLKYTF